jgi:hypothetical protein
MANTVPYTETEIRLALLRLGKRMESKEFEDKLDAFTPEKIAPDLMDKKSLNIAIAESNGISVKDLIDSPNYEALKSEYTLGRLSDVVALMESDLGIANDEAWAIMALGIGLIK